MDGAKVGADVAVFSLQGKVIASGKAVFRDQKKQNIKKASE